MAASIPIPKPVAMIVTGVPPIGGVILGTPPARLHAPLPSTSPSLRNNFLILQQRRAGVSRPACMMPRVIAHRGARQIAPENTIAAIRAARHLGMTFCEVDVMLSSDGVAFIHHDRVLGRCTNGEGFFADKTAEEIKQLDAGRWFDPSFEGERVPLLSELLRECINSGLGLNIEIKHLREKADDVPTEEQTAAERRVAEETCRVLKEQFPLADLERVCFSSFSVAALEVCVERLPAVPRSLLVEAIPEDWERTVERLGAVSLNFNHKKATREEVEDVAETGVPMYCFTVNEPERALELFSWGVSGVFSDCPDVVESAILSSEFPPSPPCA